MSIMSMRDRLSLSLSLEPDIQKKYLLYSLVLGKRQFEHTLKRERGRERERERESRIRNVN